MIRKKRYDMSQRQGILDILASLGTIPYLGWYEVWDGATYNAIPDRDSLLLRSEPRHLFDLFYRDEINTDWLVVNTSYMHIPSVTLIIQQSFQSL